MRYLMALMILGCFALAGCLSETSSAPVESLWPKRVSNKSTYVVRPGDTVYSIAWRYGLDYRRLARFNHLSAPYLIWPGQSLRLGSQKPAVPILSEKKTVRARRSIVERGQVMLENKPIPGWRWPVRGRIVAGFSPGYEGNPGIDIAGIYGEPVHAAAGGVVVYSSDGIRGYGNLLIIKHNDSYLSAYAYNRKLLVGLGERVKAGQVVAELGRNNAGRSLLHFEIRQNGQPVDPVQYLK